MNERNSVIGGPENVGSDLVEVCCSQYFRTSRAAIYQMFDDTTKETCAI
jgi:hypothetical protein